MVELVVALALIAIVAVGFTVSIGLGFRTIAVARQRTTASEIAAARLEHLRNIPFEYISLSSAPSYNADPEHPDHWLSADGSTYDVNGDESGGVEPLIVDTTYGDVLHLEDPVQVGSTVMEIYQYATWVDDPAIPGTEDYRRVTVVVRYKAPAVNGINKILRSSTLFTPGSITVGGSATTTVATSTTIPATSTTLSSSTTTIADACAGDLTAPTGSFSIGATGDAEVGFTSSQNISLQYSFTDSCTPIIVNFSNDGSTWGEDVVYDPANPQMSWSLTAGNGVKTVYGQVRDGNGTTTLLVPRSVTLDSSPPTSPSAVTRTVSCTGSTRSVSLSWVASSDAEGNLRGYRVYRSTDASTWHELGTSASTSLGDNHDKTLNSVRYYIVAYDKAGNVSDGAPDPVISLAKNQCS
jgi:hypothetical protein